MAPRTLQLMAGAARVFGRNQGAEAAGRNALEHAQTRRAHLVCAAGRMPATVAMAATVMVEVMVTVGRPLGMVLEENANKEVFVDELVAGGNAEVCGEVQVGDVLLACGTDPDPALLTAATDFDSAMDTLGSNPESPTMTLKLQRTIAAPPGAVVTAMVEGAGELTLKPDSVLRNSLLDENMELYNSYGKMMNCGGGGSCGTCAVEVLEGMDQLSDCTDAELRLLKKKPENYRLACQTLCEGRGSGNVVLRCKPK